MTTETMTIKQWLETKTNKTTGNDMKVNQKLIKSEITKCLGNDFSAGSMNGTIKKMIVFIDENNEWQGTEGRVAVFYKNCKPFTNHENKTTERPCEFFSFELTFPNDEDEDEKTREIEFRMNESDFFDSISSEWQDKKADKMSDSEFVGFWI